MNLEKLLELIYVLFTLSLHLLWANGVVNDAHFAPILEHGALV
jgi:hypothetical protein